MSQACHKLPALLSHIKLVTNSGRDHIQTRVDFGMKIGEEFHKGCITGGLSMAAWASFVDRGLFATISGANSIEFCVISCFCQWISGEIVKRRMIVILVALTSPAELST